MRVVMNMGAAEKKSLGGAPESDAGPCVDIHQGPSSDDGQRKRVIEALGPLLLAEVKARTKRKENRKVKTEALKACASVVPTRGRKRKRNVRKVVVSDSEGHDEFVASGNSRGCVSLSGSVRRLRGEAENESESEPGDKSGSKRQKGIDRKEDGVGKEKILEKSDAAAAESDGPHEEGVVRGENLPAEKRKNEEVEIVTAERVDLPREIGDQPTVGNGAPRKRPWEESWRDPAAEELDDGKRACVGHVAVAGEAESAPRKWSQSRRAGNDGRATTERVRV
jgi:hypothetical protein